MFQVPGRRADSLRIGRYTNFLDTTNGWSTQAQTFTMSGRWYESYNANPMTVAEYEAALNAWCDSLANPEQGVDAARNELAAAQGVAEDAGNKVNVASQAVAAKQAQVERATADVDAATAKARMPGLLWSGSRLQLMLPCMP